ncbi:hypothetical protein A0J61_01024 [Choanephora cucurbitarum]|uniref:Uncharacterized protein n=1 Tax=Choanephora cucurbitarum TaxID=101091 RepID=A0A1C7NP80_9FUNG|nr:hypothetical protein A0J61_01024 [Choanephora cucurbitarum]
MRINSIENLINPTSLLGHSFQNPSSSMASDEDEHNDQLISLPQVLQDQHAHKRDFSITRATLKQDNGRRTPSSSINKMSDLPTPFSGYDGNTEGPVNGDVN